MKKTLFALLTLVLIAGLLTACNSKGNTSEGSNGETLEKVELKVFIAQPRFKEQYETYIDQFIAKQKKKKVEM